MLNFKICFFAHFHKIDFDHFRLVFSNLKVAETAFSEVAPDSVQLGLEEVNSGCGVFVDETN